MVKNPIYLTEAKKCNYYFPSIDKIVFLQYSWLIVLFGANSFLGELLRYFSCIFWLTYCKKQTHESATVN